MFIAGNNLFFIIPQILLIGVVCRSLGIHVMMTWHGNALSAFCEEKLLVTMHFIHVGPVVQGIEVFFVAKINNFLNKHPICLWFDTPT